MNRRYFPVVCAIAILLLSACSSTADATTEFRQPVNPPELPGEVNVEGLLLQPGDLPDGYRIAAEYPQVPETRIFLKLPGIPKADRTITVRLDNPVSDGDEWLVVQIFVDAARADTSYEMLTGFNEFVSPQPLDPVLGAGILVEKTTDSGVRQTLIYRQCNMIVFIDTTADSVSYAMALNARIAPLFCGE